ncbi:FAD-dependent oxidoreductase [Sphaerisporangium perillae]|uniref:FAD-dependent oxidoreductase n=1 Tax=Sphaerisporangium perillae TaxID=2935860 RepID=UPI00200F26CF|nr:FAD-dependent oxidoreductase [Sphaerisporangium perillae]
MSEAPEDSASRVTHGVADPVDPAGQAVYDVVVVGAGVVGSAIARELSHHDLRVALIDAADDVGEGTSKANTAILHTGFDATPGTLESRLVRRGYELLKDYAAATGIPVEPLGALLVAWDAEQLAALPGLRAKAEANGYPLTRIIDADEVYRREPRLGPGALGALEVPGESIICPWTATLAYATEAVRAGVDLRLSTRVVDVVPGRDGTPHEIHTGCGVLRARHVVNAAGLWSDELDRRFGHQGFTVTPRRGELMVFDKLARPLVNHILLPVPTSRGKGVLVAPTVYGNVMLGPTAEDLDDKTDTGSSPEGLRFLREKGMKIMPELLREQVTAVYAGLRAATEHRDYQLRSHPEQRYVCVGGIRSTGLTASLAIAEHVMELLAEAGLQAGPGRESAPPRMPGIGEALPRPYQRACLIADDPDYGRVVCHCERVTRGEIRDAMHATVPPRTLDGLRRRTRALNGRCQGFYCGAEVRDLFTHPPAPGQAPLGESEHRASPDGREPGRVPRNGSGPDRAVLGVQEADDAGAGVRERAVEVLVVGAGPAGLAAAAELARAGAGRVEVLDREEQAGGVPRHSHHTGYGIRDLRRVMTGPAYARHYTELAAAAGATVRTGVTATGWAGPLTLETTGPGGLERITAGAVVLATGARERPRSARLVPGTRPAGVYTTGMLQQAVYLRGQSVGKRAVIVGAEHVSYSAVLTLDHAGVRVAAMVTDLPRQQSYAAFRLGAGVRYRFPLLTGTTVTGLVGRARLQGVEVRRADGRVEVIEADTIVFTGDWIPDHELARRGGLDIDPGTLGPSVDTALRTSAPGVFAAGNLLHPVATADVVALDGRHVARSVLAFLSGGPGAADVPGVPLAVQQPLRWVSPGRVGPDGPPPPRDRFTLWTTRFVSRPTIEIVQDGRTLLRRHPRRTLIPNRPISIPAGWRTTVDPERGPVTIIVT